MRWVLGESAWEEGLDTAAAPVQTCFSAWVLILCPSRRTPCPPDCLVTGPVGFPLSPPRDRGSLASQSFSPSEEGTLRPTLDSDHLLTQSNR